MSSESHGSNATCHKEVAPGGPSLFQHGDLIFQTYHVGWLIAGFFTLVATAASIWLVNKHLQWYTNKREQRYIVRLLFMVPIYAIISLASFLFWNHSTPLLLIRDGYESTVLTAFFYLLLMYLSHDPEEQKAVFLKVGLSREADRIARQKGDKVEKWVFPMGFVKWKPQDGLYFLQLMKWGVLQYCVIRPTTTLAAVIMDYMGLYCEESWGLGWGHVYITIIVSLSVTIAMYCLIQLYVPVAKDLAPHKPLLKLFAVKAVVFLTFWQATFLALLSMFGVVKDTKFMTAADINIGIGALLECFEMTIFAFLHIKAFTYEPYRPFHAPKSAGPPPERTPRLRSLGHAMDFRETFREIWIGCIYVLDKIRGREPTPDLRVKRAAYYEGAFGRPRPSYVVRTRNSAREKPISSGMEVEVDEQIVVEVEGERQWLGLGDNYGYGLGYFKRERSDSLEVEIARELQRRGYTSEIPGRGHIPPAHAKESTHEKPGRRRSWWRTAYNRISQTGQEGDEAVVSARRSAVSKSRSRSRRESRHHENGHGHQSLHEHRDLEDPPPASIIHTYRKQQRRTAEREQTENSAPLRQPEGDVLAPLDVYQQRRTSNHTRGNLLRSTDSLDPYHLATPGVIAPSRAMDPSPPIMVQGAPGLPRHPSLLSSPPDFTRSDSLLGRVFPANTDVSSTELGHSESARSLLSTAGSGARHSKATPRARLILTTPQPLSRNSDVGIVQPLSSRTHRGADSIGRVPVAMVAEFIERYDGAAPGPTIRKGSHFREPAALIHSTPVPDQDIATSLPQSKDCFVEAHTKQPPTAGYQPHSPPRSQGLRRNSAQIYRPSEAPSKKHRSTLPAADPNTSTRSFYADSSTSIDTKGHRHASTPIAPGSASISTHNDETRTSTGSALSAQAQPSHSGTPAMVKHHSSNHEGILVYNQYVPPAQTPPRFGPPDNSWLPQIMPSHPEFRDSAPTNNAQPSPPGHRPWS